MTVSTTTNKVRINGNGITTSFPFQFPILKNDFSDLKVYRIDIDEETQEETETLLSITTNYTITVTKNLEQRITSGYINLINENNEPLALTENQALFIMREEEITQDLDLYENQKFPYKNLENMLDKIIVINQQQQEQIDRTLKTSSFFTGSLSETITSPVENRSLKWKKKQDGTFYVSNSDTDVDEVYNQIVNNSNVIAVGQNINNVNINANNINNINTTANNINNINNVAENINNIDIVNENIDNINVVKDNIHNVNTTANNIASVNNVAENINNVNTLAANITTIQTKANTNLNNIDTTAKETITNLSAPSSRTIEISLTVGETLYTAPANGYIGLQATASSSGGAVELSNYNNPHIGNANSRSGISGLYCCIPVAKGDLVRIYEYNCSNYSAKFIYTNGN